ncbi:MAG: nucleoside hydrolase [Christensenellales bacterium]
MYKVIFDTDIGCDIDDAVSLAYLLSRQDCDLLGITTVNGDTIARAKLASALCIAAGREVPIYPGAQDTLLTQRMRKPVPQAKALDTLPHQKNFVEDTWLSFLNDTIMAYPGEVTLLAVGPMTNIGLLFAAYPKTAQALRSLVLMGGNFQNPLTGLGYMESNTMCDPHASALVYTAKANIHRSVGCDVTNGLFMKKDIVYACFPKNKVLNAVLPMADVYFSNGGKAMYFHDLCAAASIFNDHIISWSNGLVEVELTADALLGMTVIKHAAYLPGHHQIAVKVDKAMFDSEISETFGI